MSISDSTSKKKTHPTTGRDAPLHVLWRIMEGHRLQYAIAIAALLFANLLAYTAPLVVGVTLEAIVGDWKTTEVAPISRQVAALLGGYEYLAAHRWVGAVISVLLTAVGGYFAYSKGWFSALAADGIARRLKNKLYDHLQHLPTRYHDTADTGDLVQRCTSDVETVRLCLSAQITEIGNGVLLVITALPLMLLLSPVMTGVSFILILPIVLFGFIYFAKVKHLFRHVDEAEGRVTSVVQENLNGIRVVRAFARQAFENKRFESPNADYRDRSLAMLRAMAWYWSASDMVCLLQNGLVLFGGAYQVANGSITVGTFFIFLTFINLLLWPVRQMGRILTDLGKTTVALGRIREILDAQEEDVVSRTENAETPKFPATGAIAYHDVAFAHRRAPDGRVSGAESRSEELTEDQHALNGVSFSVKAGETIAILGPSGSGKSTLIHLLLRLYDCDRGHVEIDGRPVSELDRKWVRSQVGVVMQEPFLYSKTLFENIRLGRSAASQTEVTEAASFAAIHETITNFDQGYETQIGERGITLSGGQRQRVAIARAVLKNPPVLVLDDALSAVDSETETSIIDALRQRRGKRTTILIAHRLSTLAHADRIIVLEKGRITQTGTHKQLAAESGLYQRLWKIQTQLDADVAEPLGQPA